MRRPSSRFRRRSRFAGFGQSSGRTIGVPGPGSAIIGPADYRQAPAPGSYKHAALGVPAHTHDHHALNGLTDDDHSGVAYLRIPRDKLRVVAAAGAPYTDPKAAIEACSAGDCVLITGGTYDLTATITVPDDDISIIGVNREAVVFNNTTAGAQRVLTLGGHDGIEIRNLTILANAANTDYGIYGSGSHDVTISNVKIVSAALARSIDLEAGARCLVEQCVIDTGGQMGILFLGMVDSTVAGCDLASSYDAAAHLLKVQSDSDRVTLKHNRLHLTGTAVTAALYTYNNDDLIIERNLIRVDDPGAGTFMFISAFSQNNVRHEVIGNRILLSGNNGTGIRVGTTNPWTLDECIISGNGIFDGAVGVHLVDARVTDTLVHGNKVATCTAGVSDAGTNTQALDND